MHHKYHEAISDHIVNQMLKGINGLFPEPYQGKKNESKRVELCNLLRPFIVFFVPYVPDRNNASIGAVICKCAVKYNLEKALAFAKAVNSGHFKGYNDPAHLLWLMLAKKSSLKNKNLYALTVTAARAYCEERELGSLRESTKDICDWTDDLIASLQVAAGELATKNSSGHITSVI